MTLPRAGLAVWALALGQTLTYAGAYYSFAALLPVLLDETGLSKAQLAAGPTLAFLVTAVLTPLTGRLVDRGQAGRMLVGLPVLAGLAVAGLGMARGQGAWIALWLVIGAAQAGMLYETAFAWLVQRQGGQARAAITRVTLVAGLASTLAFPLGHWLGAVLGAKGALIAFGALMILGAAPAHLVAVRGLRGPASAPRPEAGADRGALRAALRRPAFWLIAAVFGAMWLNHAVLITYVLVLAADRGAGPGLAALAASCIGPSQVAGRIALMAAGARLSNGVATVLALVAAVGASAAFLAASGWIGFLFVFAVLQGAGAGILSILRPVLTVDHLGRRGFGAISGAIAVAPILATAAGPSIGAVTLGLGVGATLAVALALAGLALVLALALTRQARAPA